MHEEIRSRVFKRITALEKGYRQNLGLIGLEGVGKTSLLHSIFHTLCGQSQFIPVYVNAPSIDYELFIDKWLEAMLRGVFLSQAVLPPSQLESLITAADPVIPKTVEKIKLIKKTMRREKNSTLVRDLFSLTGVLAEETSKKVILMIDEFQALQILPSSDPFAVLGKEIMIEKNTLYVVSSSEPKLAVEIFHEKLSLLFSNFEILEIGSFNPATACEYLKNAIPSYQFSPAQQRMLIHMTGAHPSYLRILVSRIKDKYASFKKSDLSFEEAPLSLPNEFFFDALRVELFEHYGSLSLLFEKKLQGLDAGKDKSGCIKVLLSLSKGPSKPSDIADDVNQKASEVKKYLTRLTENNRVLKSGSFYFIEDTMFALWLRNVFAERQTLHLPGQDQNQQFVSVLEQQLHGLIQISETNLETRLERLFRVFRDEVVSIEGKKFCCPHFSELALWPGTGKKPLLFARAQKIRWACQIFDQKIQEEDILLFQSDIKQHSKHSHKKVLIALGDIEHSAKLLSQESKIQLWFPKDLNFLFGLYRLPPTILLPRQEANEPVVGALAQGIYSA